MSVEPGTWVGRRGDFDARLAALAAEAGIGRPAAGPPPARLAQAVMRWAVAPRLVWAAQRGESVPEDAAAGVRWLQRLAVAPPPGSAAVPPGPVCEACEGPLRRGRRGPAGRYCSPRCAARCRQRAHRAGKPRDSVPDTP